MAEGPPAHGLPLTLRCPAAWWRISDGPELPAHQPSVLTAAIHPMAGYRAGEAGITHDALPPVTATESGEITPLLQARLRLSPEQPWQRVYHPVDVRQDRDDAGEEDAGEGAGAADGGG